MNKTMSTEWGNGQAVRRSILQEMIEDAGWETRRYSGRGMGGESCLAVALKRDEVASFLASVLEEAFRNVGRGEGLSAADVDRLSDRAEALADALRRHREDDLGMDLVVYFPGTLRAVPDEEFDVDAFATSTSMLPPAKEGWR